MACELSYNQRSRVLKQASNKNNGGKILITCKGEFDKFMKEIIEQQGTRLADLRDPF